MVYLRPRIALSAAFLFSACTVAAAIPSTFSPSAPTTNSSVHPLICHPGGDCHRIIITDPARQNLTSRSLHTRVPSPSYNQSSPSAASNTTLQILCIHDSDCHAFNLTATAETYAVGEGIASNSRPLSSFLTETGYADLGFNEQVWYSDDWPFQTFNMFSGEFDPDGDSWEVVYGYAYFRAVMVDVMAFILSRLIGSGEGRERGRESCQQLLGESLDRGVARELQGDEERWRDMKAAWLRCNGINDSTNE